MRTLRGHFKGGGVWKSWGVLLLLTLTACAPTLLPDSVDPVLSHKMGREIRVPHTTPAYEGKPMLHASELTMTPLLETDSATGWEIEGLRDPLQDIELAMTRLLVVARASGDQPVEDLSAAEEMLAILLGTTEGRVYDGFPLLNYNPGALVADQVPDEYKMKRLVDTGETVRSQIDGELHKVWEVTINMLWYGHNFDSDTFLLRVPYEAQLYDEFRINWRIYSLIQEDIAPTTILNDGFGRIFHGLDSTFTSVPAETLAKMTIKYPSLIHFKGMYTWGWGVHPPRVQFLQPVFEDSPDGELNPAGESFATRTRENLTIENIGEAAPEKKAYRVATAAMEGATGSEIAAMLMDPDVAPSGTFREWTRLAADLRQLPPEAWEVLQEEEGIGRDEYGDYDIILAYLNNEIYGVTPYAQVGTEAKGAVVRDWEQGGSFKVKIINLDNMVHYYRNVDFGDQLPNEAARTFGNGSFSFGKFNAKPTYGVPKVAEMQWRTGWGFVPHAGINAQAGVFPREEDQALLTPFTDQLGKTHPGYIFKRVSGYWRFNPPAKIREGANIPAGDPLRDADGEDGVLISFDAEAFGVAKMPKGAIITHPYSDTFPELRFPGFLRNPNGGGDIIPPTRIWAPFLTMNPETGTLKAPDGRYWVDYTYFHGRPVDGNSSITANVEAPRAGAQLFYQFDPLFHDNMIFSYHPRSDAVSTNLR